MTDKEQESPPRPQLPGRHLRSLLILLAVFVLVSMLFRVPTGPEQVEMGEFLADLQSGQITSLQMDQAGGTVTYSVPGPEGDEEVRRALVLLNDTMLDEVRAAVPDLSIAPRPFFDTVSPIVWFSLTLGITLLVLFVILRRMGGAGEGPTAFGQSRAKEIDSERPETRFLDVAGMDEAKAELEEVVLFLKDPSPFRSLGARITKGVLLIGPPGCGKTLLARAVAGEGEVPFFHTSGSEFVELFVGVGASRVRNLFDKAKKAPGGAVVFLDEIDAVGRQRGAGLGGGHDEREQTLNQILVEMDGFESHDGIIVLAATNRPDILDPALLRSGRFDRKVLVDFPDRKGREAILEIHARGKPLAEGADLGAVAAQTPGFSGADLENVLNEAALLAAREKAEKVTSAHLTEAVERVVMGPERRSLVITPEEREVLAWHEGGHALSSYVLGTGAIHKVTIIPRARALGYVLNLPEKDRYIQTRAEMLDTLAVALAGRAAERLKFNHVSTGAKEDIRKVSEIARSMVRSLGMSDAIGPVAYEGDAEPFLGRELAHARNYSEATAEEIDREVRAVLIDAERRAGEVLAEHMEALERLASILLEKESLNRDEFAELMVGLGVPSGAKEPPAGEEPEEAAETATDDPTQDAAKEIESPVDEPPAADGGE